jgi:hypothetical protein
MECHPNDVTTEEQLDVALERAKLYNPPRIVEATFERDLDLLVLKISDGRRLVFPRENLQALAGSTAEQAADFVVGPHGTNIWWPQMDEGHYLPNMLEGRTGNDKWMAKIQRREVAA